MYRCQDYGQDLLSLYQGVVPTSPRALPSPLRDPASLAPSPNFYFNGSVLKPLLISVSGRALNHLKHLWVT